jgi:glycosyltransferase involved in cell wall biosynthesis
MVFPPQLYGIYCGNKELTISKKSLSIVAMIPSENKPLISVCVPAYNNADVIKSTIEHIIDQTYTNWELIIQDDCSTDATLQVAKSFSDPRIIIIENSKNLGLVANWNKVVTAAKGEYVKLLGADDLLAPACLEKQVSVFLSGRYPAVSLVASYKNIIDDKGKLLMLRKYPFKSGLVPSAKAISRNFLLGTNLVGEPVVGLYKTSVFSKIGLYDDSNPYLVDLDFWVRVLLTGDLYVIPEPLVSFRISRGAMTSRLKSQQAKLFKQFAKKVYNDKRFNINYFHYLVACFMSTIIAILRRSFMYLHLR